MIKAACLLLALAWALHAPAQTPRPPANPPFVVPPLVVPPPRLNTVEFPPSPLTETALHVEIRDPDGNSIPGACVDVLETRLLVVADQWGLATCMAPPGTKGLTLLVSATGCRPQREYIALPLAAATPIVITLRPARTTPYNLRIIPCEDGNSK